MIHVVEIHCCSDSGCSDGDGDGGSDGRALHQLCKLYDIISNLNLTC